MRAMWAAVALCAVACGAPADPSPQDSSTVSAASTQVNPARIDRVRTEVPDGYEVAGLRGPVAPAGLWGFGAGWTADPSRCGVLADPAADGATMTGWSASGAGGIVYALAAASEPPDPSLIADCERFTLASGQTNGTVTRTSAPAIDDAQTVAMATAATTVVEGGTETRSHSDTVTAYLGGHVVVITVVTDPGSPNPQLGAEFAAALAVKTVSALRG